MMSVDPESIQGWNTHWIGQKVNQKKPMWTGEKLGTLEPRVAMLPTT